MTYNLEFTDSEVEALMLDVEIMILCDWAMNEEN